MIKSYGFKNFAESQKWRRDILTALEHDPKGLERLARCNNELAPDVYDGSHRQLDVYDLNDCAVLFEHSFDGAGSTPAVVNIIGNTAGIEKLVGEYLPTITSVAMVELKK